MNSYRLALREYRFYLSLKPNDFVSVLATSKLNAADKISHPYIAVSRHNVVMRSERNEWALCHATSWDSLMGGL